MTRIRLLRSHLNVAGASRLRGDVVHVDDEVAAYLCAGGQAEQVEVIPVVVEVVATVPPETTVLHSTTGRTRVRPRETR